MQPLRFDFPVITNSDYVEELSFQVRDTYLDITGHSFLVQLRLTPNGSTVFATLGTVGSPTAQGLYPIEPTYGGLQIRVPWETIKAAFQAAYPNRLVGDAASLYYDLLVTLPGGDQEVWLFGYFHLTKGITNG